MITIQNLIHFREKRLLKSSRVVIISILIFSYYELPAQIVTGGLKYSFNQGQIEKDSSTRNPIDGDKTHEHASRGLSLDVGESSNVKNTLVAYYPFNGSAEDESGNGNNGNVFGETSFTIDRFGNSNSAPDYNGFNSHIEIPDNGLLNPGIQAKTIAFWYRTEATKVMTLFSKEGNNSYLGATMNDEELKITIDGSNGAFSIFDFPSQNDGLWHFISIVFDSTEFGFDSVAIFHDNQFSYATHENKGDYTPSSSLWLGVNRIGNNGWQYFSGSIDDLRVYEGALSVHEIGALYREGGWSNAENNSTIFGFNVAGMIGSEIIDNGEILITVYNKIDISNLSPAIQLPSGATIEPKSGISQDFSIPVNYLVTAKDRITQQLWTVKLENSTQVAYFPFDNHTLDESGNNLHGLKQGITFTNGIYGFDNSAGYFDGIDDFVDITNTDFIKGSTGFSVSMWIYPESFKDIPCLFVAANSSADQYIRFQLLEADEYIVLHIANGIDNVETYQQWLPPLNQWTHLVAILDRDEKRALIYANGQLLSETSYSDLGDFDMNEYRLGRDIGNFEINLFHGRMDEVQLFDEALSVEEITQLYEGTSMNSSPEIQDETFMIKENEDIGVVVGQILANDPDGDDLNYEIIAGNVGNTFNVDNNGQIGIINKSRLDYENGITMFNLEIRVFDGISADTAMVTINIQDANDQAIILPHSKNPIEYLINEAGLELGVQVSDEDGIANVSIYYRVAGGNSYDAFELNDTLGTFGYFELNDERVNRVGMEYFFTVEDSLGNLDSSEVFMVYTKSAYDAYTLEHKGDVGTSTKDYSLIAFPFNDPAADNLLSELGTYNKKDWRMYRYNNPSGYEEYKNEFFAVNPGEGFWFIQQKDIELKVGGRAVEIVEGVFKMDLSHGYNLIGNPFPGILNWDQVMAHNQSKGIDIQDFDNAGLYTYDKGYVSNSSILNEYEGGFLVCNKDISGFEIPLSALNRPGSRISKRKVLPAKVNIDNAQWTVDFFIRSTKYDYFLSGIGMHPEARDDRDWYDHGLMPRFVDYLEVIFEDGSTKSVKETSDLKSWKFTMPNNLLEKSFEVSWDIPVSMNKTIILVDGAAKRVYDLSETQSIQIANDPDATHFLYYGAKDRIYAELDLPFEIVFEAYPNPIYERVNFSIYSTKDDRLLIELIAMDGCRVLGEELILAKGFNHAGFSMESVPAGIYLVFFNNQPRTKLIKK